MGVEAWLFICQTALQRQSRAGSRIASCLTSDKERLRLQTCHLPPRTPLPFRLISVMVTLGGYDPTEGIGMNADRRRGND